MRERDANLSILKYAVVPQNVKIIIDDDSMKDSIEEPGEESRKAHLVVPTDLPIGS